MKVIICIYLTNNKKYFGDLSELNMFEIKNG